MKVLHINKLKHNKAIIYFTKQRITKELCMVECKF